MTSAPDAPLTRADEATAPPAPDERVTAAVRGWQRRLVDAGGPNTLLWFDDSGAGTLDLTTAHPGGVSMLMAGRATRLSDLVRERSALAEARRRAELIREKTVELAQERGLACGFMAIGMATWAVAGARRSPQAPVLLRGCTLTPTDPTHRDYSIDLAPSVELNPVLVHYLASEQGIAVDPEAIAALALSNRRFDPMPVFREVVRMCRAVSSFRIADRKIIAPFSYAKLPLVADLVAHGEDLATRRLVIALAEATRTDFTPRREVPPPPAGGAAPTIGVAAGAPSVAGAPAGADSPAASGKAAAAGSEDVAPAAPTLAESAADGATVAGVPEGGVRRADAGANSTEQSDLLVLDADADQRALVATVRAGHNVALDAPPGSGRTQSIVNVVAAAVADGRRVLVVAEDTTALIDVEQRLADVGLEHLCLQVGEGGLDHGHVARAVRDGLEIVRSGPRRTPDPSDVAAALRQREEALDEHRDALHTRRDPWGVSVFDGLAALARLTRPRRPPTSRVRITGEALTSLDRPAAERAGQLLCDAAAAGAWSEERRKDPWAGARVIDDASRRRALETTRELSTQRLADDQEALDAVLAACGLPPARTPDDWAERLSLIAGVRDSLRAFDPAIFATDLPAYLGATGDADYRTREQLRQSWWTRYSLRRKLRELVRDGSELGDPHDALAAVHDQVRQWRALCGDASTPRVPAGLDAARNRWTALEEQLRWLADRLATTDDGGDLHGTPLDDLRARLARLASRGDRLDVLPLVVPLLDELALLGLGPLADDLAARRVGPEFVAAEMDFVWWRSVLDEIARRDPRVAAHDAVALREQIAEYGALLAAWQRTNIEIVSARHAAAVRTSAAEHPDQVRLVHEEAARLGGHRSVAELLETAPDVVMTTRPCWLTSPLVVASTLPPGEHFDLLVVEEAGHLESPHVISALGRARQVLLVGDTRQLPPRGFVTGVPRIPSAVRPGLGEQTRSLLEEYQPALKALTLTGHYRSRDERLVAFANAHCYDGTLRTLPGAGGTGDGPPVRLVTVDAAAVPEPAAEAPKASREQLGEMLVPHAADAGYQRVVDVVLEHARSRPSESLAVACLTSRDAERIIAVLRGRLDDERDPQVMEFFDESRERPALIAPLERLHARCRDAVILVAGVDPEDRSWPPAPDLGILVGPEGERALAVALTLARRRFTLVSMVTAADLDGPLRSRGTQLLRDLIDYCERGGDSPTDEHLGTLVDEDPVLAEFAVRLRQEGLVVYERYGSGPHPIDLVVEDPHLPGRAIVAVESDGPRYAAVTDTRERELLRAARLRSVGWEYVGVCSADIFADPARDVARVLDAVRAADARSGWSGRGRARIAQRPPRRTTRAAAVALDAVRLDAVAPEPEETSATLPDTVGTTGAKGAKGTESTEVSPTAPAAEAAAADVAASADVEGAERDTEGAASVAVAAAEGSGEDAPAEAVAQKTKVRARSSGHARPPRPRGFGG